MWTPIGETWMITYDISTNPGWNHISFTIARAVRHCLLYINLCAVEDGNISRVKDHWVFLAVLCVIILLYARVYDAGFVTDFTGLWAKMQGKNFTDALRSFDFPSLMPLLNVMYFMMYKVAGMNPVIWFLVPAILYTTGLLFLYKLVFLLMDSVEVRGSVWVAAVAVLLVMTSPYQVEAMVWKVGLGHISSVTFFMMALYFGTKHLVSISDADFFSRSLLLMMLFQLASHLCFEWAIVFPLILILFGWLLKRQSFFHQFIKTVLVSVFIVIIYFILTTIVIGKPIGHYDIQVDGVGALLDMYGNMWKYWIKHLGYMHFASFKMKTTVYGITDASIFRMTSLLILIAYAVYTLNRSKRSRLAVVLVACCFVGLILVSPLHFQQVHMTENDRYASLFMPFFCFLVALVLRGMHTYFKYMVLGVLMITNIWLQQRMISDWASADKILSSLVETFPSDIDKHTLILNIPDNLDGVPMIRDYSGQNPLIDLMAVHGKHITDMDYVVQYKIGKYGQRFDISYESESTLKLSMQEWGSWWMREGQGIKEYETDYYKATCKEKKLTLTLKDVDHYNHIIYTDGNEWKFLKGL